MTDFVCLFFCQLSNFFFRLSMLHSITNALLRKCATVNTIRERKNKSMQRKKENSLAHISCGSTFSDLIRWNTFMVPCYSNFTSSHAMQRVALDYLIVSIHHTLLCDINRGALFSHSKHTLMPNISHIIHIYMLLFFGMSPRPKDIQLAKEEKTASTKSSS